MILSVAFFFSFPLVFGQVENKIIKEEKELIKEIKEEIKEEKEDVKEEKEDIELLKEQLNSIKKEIKHLEGNDVNYQAEQSFYTDFGDVPNVKWERVDPYDVAEFTNDGKLMRAYYDFYADLIGTTHEVNFTDLPESAQKEIKEKYEDYEIGPVIFFDNLEANPGLVLLYGIQFESEKNYFVELRKGSEKIIVQVLESGVVSYFDDIE